MIIYKPTTWKELDGDYKASVESVEVEPNSYYNPKEPNSTEDILSIGFNLVDPETLEDIPFTQKFVAPLTNGNGLFQQLFDASGLLPDEDGGSIDEQDFVGLKVVVSMGKRKAKNGNEYPTIAKLVADESVSAIKATKKPTKKKSESSKEDDLPFG